jgi:LysM repeat protein
MEACETWTGWKNSNGYGYLKDENTGKVISAHRRVYERANGPILAGMVVCHRCDNPSCVKLEHLFLGTQKDNLQDAHRKGRLIGRNLGERNGRTHLTEHDVSEIRKRRESGETCASIAQDYGVTYQAIWSISKGKNWKATRICIEKQPLNRKITNEELQRWNQQS